MGLRKLTLSIEPAVVQAAKESAAEWNTSISSVFTRVLRAMTSPRPADLDTSPITRRASGLIRLPPTATDTELLADALNDKYGDHA